MRRQVRSPRRDRTGAKRQTPDQETTRPGSQPPRAVPTSQPVVYRDESEALRARIDLLESELGSLRRENAHLRHGDGERSPGGGGLSERMLGGKVVISLAREIDAALPVSGHAPVLDTLRTELRAIGKASIVGTALAWQVGPRGTQRAVEVAIAVRDGRTHVRMVERLGGLAGGLFGGLVGGAGAGGLGVVVPLLATVDPTLGLIAAPAWIAGVYTIVRTIYGATARRRARHLSSLMDEVERTIRSTAE